MLDRLKLAVGLEKLSDKLFPAVEKTIEVAVATYNRVATDLSFKQRAAEAESSFLVPSWAGTLTDFVSCIPATAYTVLAVDGSQVYPDRHVAGAGCFLLNIGGVCFTYGVTSSVRLFSDPEVCPFSDFAAVREAMTSETVDLLREGRELARAATEAAHLDPETALVLFDGTIVFWMLEGKAGESGAQYLASYLESLQALYVQRMVCAGYISMPKNREVMSLVKLGLCRFTVANCIPCHGVYDMFPCKVVDSLLDTHLMAELLKPGERSPLFASTSKVTAYYPAHLKPWFCYLHVGGEIARLEMPAWVAEDESLVARLCAVALDQADKGGGYPVVLAEAHEQAVVKGVDRDFFYGLIVKIGLQHNKRLRTSLKSMSKRCTRF